MFKLLLSFFLFVAVGLLAVPQSALAAMPQQEESCCCAEEAAAQASSACACPAATVCAAWTVNALLPAEAPVFHPRFTSCDYFSVEGFAPARSERPLSPPPKLGV